MPTAAEVSDALEQAMSDAVLDVTAEGTSTDEVNTPIFRARMQAAYDATIAQYFGTATISTGTATGTSSAIGYAGTQSQATTGGDALAAATGVWLERRPGTALSEAEVLGVGRTASKAAVAGSATVTAAGVSASRATASGNATVTSAGNAQRSTIGIAAGLAQVSGMSVADATFVTFTASPDHANVINYQARLHPQASPATIQNTQDLGVPTPNASNQIVVSLAPLYAGQAAGTYVVSIATYTTGGVTDSGVSNAFTLPIA